MSKWCEFSHRQRVTSQLRVPKPERMYLCRWVNCLLLREVPFLLSLRLWDTYLAEGPRMKDFLKYVLAAFLLYWSSKLSTMDFQVHCRFGSSLPSIPGLKGNSSLWQPAPEHVVL